MERKARFYAIDERVKVTCILYVADFVDKFSSGYYK